jgi:hypothetical protein
MSRFMRQAGYRLIKKLKLGLVVGLVCLLCIVYTSNTIAQTGSVSSELPNSIVIGVRDIAYPIANNITKSSTDGFCGTFGKILSDKVKPRVVTYVDLTNEYLDSRYRRFDGLRKGTTVIECGPNSASIKGKSIAEGIDFSDTSFYSTGVKLLLKNELANTLVQDLSNGNSFLVGCIKNTTTCDLITQKGLIPKELATLDQALDALNSGTIKIYANTEIILRSLLKYGVKEKLNNKGELLRKSRDPLERSGYTISPSKPGSYITGDIKTEKLVIALAKNTSYHDVLKNVIENVLKSDDVIMAGKQLDEKDPPSPPPTTQPTDGEPNSGKQKHREGNFFIETIIPSLTALSSIMKYSSSS